MPKTDWQTSLCTSACNVRPSEFASHHLRPKGFDGARQRRGWLRLRHRDVLKLSLGGYDLVTLRRYHNITVFDKRMWVIAGDGEDGKPFKNDGTICRDHEI